MEVIDPLEEIQIHHEKSKRPAGPFRQLEIPMRELQEPAAVHCSRQPVQ
jgi:hypothetical protein